MTWILLAIIALFALAYFRVNLLIYTAAAASYFLLFVFCGQTSFIAATFLALFVLTIFLPLNLIPLRRQFISGPIFSIFCRHLPNMSTTEQQALDAGTVDWEKNFFVGKFDWDAFLAHAPVCLTQEEQDFLAGPVETLCSMLDDWEITHRQADLPADVWQYLKQQGFFGLLIAKEYDGKGFSEYLHSQVLVKIAARSLTAASVITVPNSLGPAELIFHYGTKKQKDYYLPRLAKGEELPCFALTAPDAGSDATAMIDKGILCRQQFDGEEVLGISLTFNKRYITLAPVATVIALAFKLYDPEQLLGEENELGITCVLLPANSRGVEQGRRHFPLNIPFQNGPLHGENVFVPLEYVIGGEQGIGQGWKMLVECLSTGRAISLPSNSVGGAKLGLATTSAYAQIRQQFSLPIAKFSGVEEVIAKMVAFTYGMDATRLVTVAMVDRGLKPSIPSAISKYHLTEMTRIVANAAMDIHGGKGICLGPNNYLARGYQGIPIGITVEGANILTRCLIIFGQGAIRCHPFLLAEIQAGQNPDQAQGLKDFDHLLFKHLGFVASNKARAMVLGLSDGYFAKAPNSKAKRYFQHVSRLSSGFAFLVDACSMMLGASLKREEKISGRLADILSYLYMTSCVLKRFHEQQQPDEDLVIVEWICQYLLYQAQQQMLGLLENLPNRVMCFGMRIILFPLGARYRLPKDKLGAQVAKLFTQPSTSRQRLLADIVCEQTYAHDHVQLLEKTLQAVVDVQPLVKLFKKELDKKELSGFTLLEQASVAKQKGVIDEEQYQQIADAEVLRQRVIAVDDFSPEELSAD